MNLGVVTNVAIGLIFVFLLLGLIGSALQEAVAGAMNWRGKQLRAALETLLEGPPGPDETNAALTTPPAAAVSGALFAKVFTHGLIAPDIAARLPSYIPAQNFRMALFAALADGSQSPLFSQIERSIQTLPGKGLRDSLTALLVDAGGDIDRLSTAVENWFDDSMDRASGFYKRLASKFMLIFGIVIAIGGNINTIEIAKFLWTHPLIGAQVADTAQQYAAAHPEGGAASAPLVQAGNAAQTLAAVPVPMGWPLKLANQPASYAIVVFGWLATALAVSLGAPFWFDLLNKFLNIRNAGPKPKRSDDD